RCCRSCCHGPSGSATPTDRKRTTFVAHVRFRTKSADNSTGVCGDFSQPAANSASSSYSPATGAIEKTQYFLTGTLPALYLARARWSGPETDKKGFENVLDSDDPQRRHRFRGRVHYRSSVRFGRHFAADRLKPSNPRKPQ